MIEDYWKRDRLLRAFDFLDRAYTQLNGMHLVDRESEVIRQVLTRRLEHLQTLTVRLHGRTGDHGGKA